MNLLSILKKKKAVRQPLSENEIEILDQLDECAKGYNFLMLDNGYIYPIDTRFHLYFDDVYWGIIIETVEYNYRGGIVTNTLYTFGNSLKLKSGMNNENFFTLLNVRDIVDSEDDILISPEIKEVEVKGEKLDVNISQEQLRKRGIDPEVENRITVFELFRYLTVDYRDLFFCDEKVLNQQFTKQTPKKLQLEEWYHPNLANDELPSSNETFLQLAKVISEKNISYYKPTEEPNTQWTNWPAGGIL